MDKIVLDTSVFVSAILGATGGASREVIRRCLQKRYLPLMGNALFQEYEDLLSRQRIVQQCLLSVTERDELLNAFLSVCQWITIYYGWRPNLTDEADNHLVELAVAGGAAYLVTKNIKDFKRSELHFPQLQIIDPVSFIKEV